MSIQILFCTFEASDVEAFVEVMPNGELKRLSLTDDEEELEAHHAAFILVNQIELIDLYVDLPDEGDEEEDEDDLPEKESDLEKYGQWWMDRIQAAWDQYKKEQ